MVIRLSNISAKGIPHPVSGHLSGCFTDMVESPIIQMVKVGSLNEMIAITANKITILLIKFFISGN